VRTSGAEVSQPTVPIGQDEASIPFYFPIHPLLLKIEGYIYIETHLPKNFTLKMETACTSETLATLPLSIWYNNPGT
jgi:hypothetical protein